MKKAVTAIIVLAGLGLVGWQIYQKSAAAPTGGDRRDHNIAAVAVEVRPIERTTIRRMGHFSGSLYPVSEYVLAPKITGRLEKLLVHIGDRVQPGQVVAILDDVEFNQQVSQAQAELQVAQANLQDRRNSLENARREYQRTVALREKKISSASQLDAAEFQLQTEEAKLKVALAQVTEKQAALKIAEVRLSYTRIQVPPSHTGGYQVVGERFVDEGALLAPNTAIVSILDISRLVAAVHVIERDYAKIQPGLAASITTDAFPGRSFSGQVVRIAPLLKEASRQARVEIEISNPERLLKPGMFVRVAIVFEVHTDATVVAQSALVNRNDQQGVFIADRERQTARFVPVQVGIINNGRAEVLRPAISGEVVTLGHHLLEDGAAIRLPDLPGGAPSGGSERRQAGPQHRGGRP
jgi:RND family efflux transporter MFP subunit